MPRGVKDEPSLSSWFRTHFDQHPDRVRKKGSNDEVVNDWQLAHPGKQFTKRHRQAMANVKSSLKHAKRKKKRQAQPATESGMIRAVRMNRPYPGGSMEHLEVAIDRCLSTARGLEEKDPDMQQVVRHLRMARNELVWISGKS
jgi:hypothetical protein